MRPQNSSERPKRCRIRAPLTSRASNYVCHHGVESLLLPKQTPVGAPQTAYRPTKALAYVDVQVKPTKPEKRREKHAVRAPGDAYLPFYEGNSKIASCTVDRIKFCPPEKKVRILLYSRVHIYTAAIRIVPYWFCFSDSCLQFRRLVS